MGSLESRLVMLCAMDHARSLSTHLISNGVGQYNWTALEDTLAQNVQTLQFNNSSKQLTD